MIRRITMIMIVSIVISGSLRKQTLVTPQVGGSPANTCPLIRYCF